MVTRRQVSQQNKDGFGNRMNSQEGQVYRIKSVIAKCRSEQGRIHRVATGGTCPSQTQDVLKLFKSVCTNVAQFMYFYSQ